MPTVGIAFLGLGNASALGSLPTSYIWLMMEQERDTDGGLRDFLDIFNQRGDFGTQFNDKFNLIQVIGIHRTALTEFGIQHVDINLTIYRNHIL